MASTSFLELTNRVLRRINEVEMQDTDFPSARGVHALAKDAVNAAIHRINQAEFTWPFNVSSGSQVMTVGTAVYEWPFDYLIADWDSFYIAKDDLIEETGHVLHYINRELWLKRRREMDEIARERPFYVFPGSGVNFGVSPVPDKEYTITYDYWLLPISLVLHTETPRIPSAFDEVIVQGALYHMYLWRDNVEQTQLADKMFKDNLKNMRTLLINKEDRVFGGYINTNRTVGTNSVPIGGSTW